MSIPLEPPPPPALEHGPALAVHFSSENILATHYAWNSKAVGLAALGRWPLRKSWKVGELRVAEGKGTGHAELVWARI